jgi:hypothetical protein
MTENILQEWRTGAIGTLEQLQERYNNDIQDFLGGRSSEFHIQGEEIRIHPFGYANSKSQEDMKEQVRSYLARRFNADTQLSLSVECRNSYLALTVKELQEAPFGSSLLEARKS